MRKVLVMAAALALLAVAAPAAGAGDKTASGVLIGGAVTDQVVTQGETQCRVIGGTLRTAAGQDLNLAAGGVLTGGKLDPTAQAIVDKVKEAAAQGYREVLTIGYVDSQTLCGYPLGNFVTSASLAAAPPPPTPTPYPVATSVATPPPVTRTVSGRVTKMSPVGEIAIQAPANYCEIWPGLFRTDTGETFQFAVETALSGDIQRGGLNPVDKSALRRAAELQQAGLQKGARATLTVTGPLHPCGLDLDAVVDAVTVQLPRHRSTGRVTRLRRGKGACPVWKGRLQRRQGRVTFVARSARIAKTLQQARTRKARTTITYVRDFLPCDTVIRTIVLKATVRKH